MASCTCSSSFQMVFVFALPAGPSKICFRPDRTTKSSGQLDRKEDGAVRQLYAGTARSRDSEWVSVAVTDASSAEAARCACECNKQSHR